MKGRAIRSKGAANRQAPHPRPLRASGERGPQIASLGTPECSPLRSSPCSPRCSPARWALASPATPWRAGYGLSMARDIREHGLGRHRTVDDTPAGGGPGMVMRADVLAASLDAALQPDDARPRLIMSPRGAPFTQRQAREWAAGPGLVVVCPRFEGVDERIIAGARPDRSLDRRLRAFRRRDRRARRARRLRAVDPRRDGQARVGRAGEFRSRVARISPLHAAARMGGARDSRRAAVGRSPADRQMAAGRGGADHAASGGRICSEARAALTASAPASRRGSRRSRAASCGRASRPRRISPAADTAGTWNRRGLRAAPASRSSRCRGR